MVVNCVMPDIAFSATDAKFCIVGVVVTLKAVELPESGTMIVPTSVMNVSVAVCAPKAAAARYCTS